MENISFSAFCRFHSLRHRFRVSGSKFEFPAPDFDALWPQICFGQITSGRGSVLRSNTNWGHTGIRAFETKLTFLCGTIVIRSDPKYPQDRARRKILDSPPVTRPQISYLPEQPPFGPDFPRIFKTCDQIWDSIDVVSYASKPKMGAVFRAYGRSDSNEPKPYSNSLAQEPKPGPQHSSHSRNTGKTVMTDKVRLYLS